MHNIIGYPIIDIASAISIAMAYAICIGTDIDVSTKKDGRQSVSGF